MTLGKKNIQCGMIHKKNKPKVSFKTLGRCENIFWRAQHIMTSADSDDDERWTNAATPTAKDHFAWMHRCYAKWASKNHYGKSLRPAIHLSQNMQKWAQTVKNEKCIAGCFASLFTHFTPLFSLFATFCARVGICAKSQTILWFIFVRH